MEHRQQFTLFQIHVTFFLQLKDSASIAVTGKVGDKPFIQNISCSDVHKMVTKDNTYPIHRLAAKAQLKQLEYDLIVRSKETLSKEGNHNYDNSSP